MVQPAGGLGFTHFGGENFREPGLAVERGNVLFRQRFGLYEIPGEREAATELGAIAAGVFGRELVAALRGGVEGVAHGEPLLGGEEGGGQGTEGGRPLAQDLFHHRLAGAHARFEAGIRFGAERLFEHGPKQGSQIRKADRAEAGGCLHVEPPEVAVAAELREVLERQPQRAPGAGAHHEALLQIGHPIQRLRQRGGPSPRPLFPERVKVSGGRSLLGEQSEVRHAASSRHERGETPKRRARRAAGRTTRRR